MKILSGHLQTGCRTAIFAVILASGQAAADPNDLLEQSRTLRRQFIAEKASAINTKTQHEEDTSLAQLIERMMALQVPTPADSNTITPSEPVVKKNPPPAVATRQASNGKTADVRDAASPASALEQLEKLNHETTIPYPAELADILYRAGKPDEAYRYYEMALSSVNTADVAAHQWLLFQTANCLRRTEYLQAVKRYEELIRLYPNSVWAAAAQARHRVLNWKETRHEELMWQLNQRDNHEQ